MILIQVNTATISVTISGPFLSKTHIKPFYLYIFFLKLIKQFFQVTNMHHFILHSTFLGEKKKAAEDSHKGELQGLHSSNNYISNWN